VPGTVLSRVGYASAAIAFVAAETLLIAGFLLGRAQRQRVQQRLDERLRFEILLADLAAGFIEIPAREIDQRIAAGLRSTIEELGLDRAGLAELAAGGDELRVTHGHSRHGVAPSHAVFTAEAWPWTLGRLRGGRDVVIARMADLPEEAARDRSSFAALGTQAIVILPLLVGGTVVGGFACSMQRERDWAPELVQRLRLLADIFAIVLMRRRADRAVKASETKSLALRSAIFGSLYGQVAALDRDGVIIAVNEGWATFMKEGGGDARTAGVGASYLDVCRRAATAGDPHAHAALEAVESVLQGRRERAVVEYPCATAAETRWYAMVVEPFRRPEGGLVISHIDITRRRRAEEEVQRERAELAHALRVATLGELATTLAHEINQPLAAIASNAQAAQRLLAPVAVDPEVPAALDDITDAAQRAAQVIRRLRVLFKKEPSAPQPVDLNEVIKEVIGLLRRDLERRRVRLELSLPSQTPRVLGDVVQLQQVILNVLVNAAEAMVGAMHPRELRVAACVREPAVVSITVCDTGPGVPAADLEHIFERFVTSKAEGLGMGLSISRSIVKAHGGRMWATRNVERGLTVHIELPCLET
jgi:signal transduction histidine kinase